MPFVYNKAMDKNNKLKTVACPILAAIIWGAAFAFQRKASAYLQAFTFNAARSIMAFAVLGLIAFCRRKKEPVFPEQPRQKRRLWLGGFVCGVLLFVASNLQQMGLETTEAGKSGFITSLYIVLVPLFSVMLGKKVTGRLWTSIAIALAGLFLLCVSNGFRIEKSDFLILLCAIVYAWYIIAVDIFIPGNNTFMFSCLQFFFCAVFSSVCMFLFEQPTWTAIGKCAADLLYVGVMSSAVAYTLQAIAQKAAGDAPTVTLLLSMESVCSVLFGAVMLGEFLSGRELIGCAVMLFAVILAQLPQK